jgi:hypothetical protein
LLNDVAIKSILLWQAGKNNESNTSANASRPSALHLSPDLGIDSDPGRFSSLEHSAVEHKDAHGFNSWATNKGNYFLFNQRY